MSNVYQSPASSNMTTIHPNLGPTNASVQAVEQTAGNALAKSEATAEADSVSSKPFLSKTVSVLTKGIKLGLSLVVKGSLKIAKFTAIAALKVGKAFVAAVKTASENKKTAEAQGAQPKALAKRSPTKVSEVKEAQRNLALAIREGKATIEKQRAIQKDRQDIAALERRAKALKQDDVSPAKKPNHDYTNFEKSGSTLSANANLSPKDKQDIAELEKRLNALKKP
jgi:hypothetical protein